MEFRILGPVGMYAEGRSVDVGRLKVRGLLGTLLLKANKVVDADVLADALWDGDRPPVPRHTLQVYKSRLCKALHDAGDPAAVVAEHGGYRLHVAPEIIDYHRFLAHMRMGHVASGRSDHARAATCFAAAVELWQRPLADLKTSWAQHQRETLTARDYLPALGALFEAKLELGDHEFVLAKLHPLLGDHSHDERLAHQWMRALAATHRSAEIPSFFKDFARRLDAELGVPPGDELVQLYRNLTRRPDSAAPPVSAPAARVVSSRNLPGDTPYFTGRDDLLSRLGNLAGVSIVTIDGPPGVGKTALVTHWARTQSNRFTDGVLYADLQGYAMGTPTGPATVINAFLHSLGASAVPDSAEDRAATLRRLLTNRRILVILDNVRDSEHVGPLLPAVSVCSVVITSRQQLTKLAYYGGAARITVPVLTDDAAQALLRKRISNCSSTEIEELAALCEKLPLALRIVSEHAAARPSMPIADLVEDLKRAPRLLDAGPLGDDLAASLRTVFSWSYRALAPAEARLFRLLGLHPTPQFSSHAVMAVTGFDRDITEHALDTLIGAHLIQQDRADRYSIHNALHAFAADLADEPAAAGRMADWYLWTLGNAAKLLTPDDHPVPALPSGPDTPPLTFDTQAQALQWGLAERDTLVAMTQLAAAHGLDHHVWRFAGSLGDLLDRHGNVDEQVAIHELGWMAATRIGDRRAEAGCLNNVGKALVRGHEYDRAEHFFELALQIFQDMGDRLGAAIGRHNLGTVYLERGDPRQAIRAYEQALTEIVAIGHEWSEAYVHHRLGDCYRSLDNTVEADKSYQLALALRTKIGDQRARGITLTALGLLHLGQGNTAAAIDYTMASLDIHRQTADQGNTAKALCTLASALMTDRPQQAIAHAHAAVTLYEELRDLPEKAHALTVLASAYEKAGEPGHALNTWIYAYRTLDILEDPRASTVDNHIRNLRDAMSAIPNPRPDAPEIATTKENS